MEARFAFALVIGYVFNVAGLMIVAWTADSLVGMEAFEMTVALSPVMGTMFGFILALALAPHLRSLENLNYIWVGALASLLAVCASIWWILWDLIASQYFGEIVFVNENPMLFGIIALLLNIVVLFIVCNQVFGLATRYA